ncbi:helix-turn-helix domain-containing protein [Alphaproteobacteria bacterium LSUCC0684]
MSKNENLNTDRNFMITNNNAVDVHVGQRIRRRRTLLGMSQEQLGKELNVTFQQVQKYERGSNRVSASRLWDISQILDVDISFFFDEMTSETKARSPRRVSLGGSEAESGPKVRDPMARRETLELVRNYYSIEDARTRKKVAELLKSIAATIRGK